MRLKKTSRDMQYLHLNCLPEEIRFNIFSKLPVESVLDCKLVCKPWKNLLQFHANNYFAYLHLKRQRHGSEFIQADQVLTLSAFHSSTKTILSYYVKYNKDNDNDYSTRIINLEFPEHKFKIVGSCNGLICLSVDKKKYKRTWLHNSALSRQFGPTSCTFTDEPLYICNPITREYVTLPELQTDENHSSAYIVHGFGYHPLTNEYKVIRIFYPVYESELPCTGHCEVYTLGGGRGWRSAGEINRHIYAFNRNFRSVCVDGVFYWYCGGLNKLVAFDLADENFHWLPFPPVIHHGTSELGVRSGCLCSVKSYHDSRFQVVDLWFYKTVDEGESSSYDTKEHYNHKSWCLGERWSGLEAENYEKDYTDSVLWNPWAFRTPHTSSFVSLKALGEQCQDM